MLLEEPVDLLCGYGGRTTLLEVKGRPGPRGGLDGRRLTPQQIEFFRDWKGGDICIVRTPDEALKAVGLVADLSDESDPP